MEIHEGFGAYRQHHSLTRRRETLRRHFHRVIAWIQVWCAIEALPIAGERAHHPRSEVLDLHFGARDHRSTGIVDCTGDGSTGNLSECG